MADETPPRQMSLIPYPYQNGQIVLRQGNSVVVLDANSRQLSVRRDVDHSMELSECPYCHRPLHDDSPTEASGSRSHSDSAFNSGDRFISPEYFQRLAESQRGSPSGSPGPATPSVRAFQPALRSGHSRDVSGAQGPPTGAEFIGSEPSISARQRISQSAFSPGYFKKFFTELRVLGKGGNGVVLLVEHVIDGFALGEFACKRIPVGDDHDWLEKVLQEVRTLRRVTHENLITYHFVWLEEHQPSKFGPKIPCLWMLQDYCNGGDLHAYVMGSGREDPTLTEKQKQKLRRASRSDLEPVTNLRGPSGLSLDEIFSFFKDITSGLNHLHMKKYIHRDLKPSNCLLHLDGNNRPKVVISDFGEVQAAGAQRGSTGATGTISYCAPEVLQKSPVDGTFGSFTTKSDIFSLGMIVYFMCFGRLPYNNADNINEENEDLDELRAEITKWPGFDDQLRARSDLPEKLYKYLKRLLSVDPNQRPSTSDILESINTGIADMASSIVEESNGRVSSVDSPKIRPSNARKQPPLLHRPSGLQRQTSVDTVRARSESKSQSHSRHTSPVEGSVIKRPRDIDIDISSRPSSPAQKSPQLMLPPPPPSTTDKILNTLRAPTALSIMRCLIFLAKLCSLLLPCSPYAVNAWVLYPLLGLAALEMVLPNFAFRRSVLLLGLHLALLSVALQRGRLCQRVTVLWKDL
ncbi:Ca2+/calmodulin-dependent protein kinase [Neohortaea acidophila]|uniref:non-specific serine/threonine protein kinase n=1 Tax=Neohortaea acidophila TaxID=245834 RepID=A0A6A6PR73_9PEZI|nr:Ca2+/calmodulin-dependent protein kinase [Neohortaea acidophila]KAF2482415.1 Ca2+/calmodulin-dependent protein kinase [Neohortaea acidophila]